MITIAIDEKSKAGKALLGIAKILSEKNKGIRFISEEDDTELFRLMVAARKSSISNKSDILSSLDKILAR